MADIHQPHDRIFRAVFSNADEAAGLLQTALPSAIRDHFDWTTLTPLDGSFVDDEMRGSQSDLLYQIEHIETGQPISMYLLFEHQSSPDPWMRFRLLKYCCRIWETDHRHDPESSELRPIVPVVFYQGPRGWTYSTEFADLFPEAIRSWQWVPRFKHELLDQTALEPEAVAGGVKGRITQLLMMAAFNRHVEAALQLTAQLVLSLHASDDSNEFRQFFVYLMATQDREVIERFRERLQRRGLEQGGEIMTYAQELLAEGEAKGEVKGRIKGRVEVVEGLLKVGVTWEVIEAATGLNDAGFQALKEQLSESDS